MTKITKNELNDSDENQHLYMDTRKISKVEEPIPPKMEEIKEDFNIFQMIKEIFSRRCKMSKDATFDNIVSNAAYKFRSMNVSFGSALYNVAYMHLKAHGTQHQLEMIDNLKGNNYDPQISDDNISRFLSFLKDEIL